MTHPAQDQQRCIIGEYCRLHGFIHGAEAEELRQGIEVLRDGTRGKFHRQQLQELLDDVDARDSAAFVEARPALDEAK